MSLIVSEQYEFVIGMDTHAAPSGVPAGPRYAAGTPKDHRRYTGRSTAGPILPVRAENVVHGPDQQGCLPAVRSC